MAKLTKKEFIERAKKVHGDKYDYSKVEYINSSTKVCIICPEHGEFWQIPNSHLRGNGCSACNNTKKLTTEEFIERAKKVHGDKYDYSQTKYINKRTKICIICSIHGKFEQTPHNHVFQKQGCPICGKEYTQKCHKNKFKEFMIESEKRFGDKYSFPFIKNEYENSHSKLTIRCNKCNNEFVKIACDHLTSPHGGCMCNIGYKSFAEIEIANYVKELLKNNTNIRLSDRQILNGLELDIYIPEYKIAFEYNGLYWHSDKCKDKNYHLAKTTECEKQNIQLIQIFEDEWLEHKDIVLSKIKHLLKKEDNLMKVQARKCNIREITFNDAKSFLETNHIQGYVSSTIYLGCFYNDELVGVMTFKEEKKCSNRWELNRFATDITKHCIGVGGKLFKYFIKNYNPTYIKSFADRRWSTLIKDNLYIKLGFNLSEILRPDYMYVINGFQKRSHKFNFRKNNLIKKYDFLDINMTETEMINKLNVSRIWNCGLIKYEWLK